MSLDSAVNVGFRPLYVQVREELTRHLAAGRWQPGTMLPSEHELARELGVSQGTVRKALNAMTAERILVRKQGRGTFVAEFEESRILFQFFRLYPDQGERLFPVSRVLATTAGRASAGECAALEIGNGAKVWRLSRVRFHGDTVILRELISLPADRFPDFDKLSEIPNNVYRLYSEHWGITITAASEKLKAILANKDDAQALRCTQGAPLLEIARTAYDINKRPVEYRVSRCLTDTMHYASHMG
jgi:GntR family transcriptional regulator